MELTIEFPKFVSYRRHGMIYRSVSWFLLPTSSENTAKSGLYSFGFEATIKKACGKSLENFMLKKKSLGSSKSAENETQWPFFWERTSASSKSNIPSKMLLPGTKQHKCMEEIITTIFADMCSAAGRRFSMILCLAFICSPSHRKSYNNLESSLRSCTVSVVVGGESAFVWVGKRCSAEICAGTTSSHGIGTSSCGTARPRC